MLIKPLLKATQGVECLDEGHYIFKIPFIFITWPNGLAVLYQSPDILFPKGKGTQECHWWHLYLSNTWHQTVYLTYLIHFVI